MADDPKQSIPKAHLLAIIALLVLAVVLFGIGYSWVRSAPPVEGSYPPAPYPSPAATIPMAPTETMSPTGEAETQAVLPAPTIDATHTATAVPTELPLPILENPVDMTFQDLATSLDAELTVIDQGNTGVWQFQDGSFIHPVALESDSDSAYMVDAGRVLKIDLESAGPPHILLSSGDLVEGVQVLEPLDMALSGEKLLVLDRASDVYRYNITSGEWQLDRYDRPVEDSSGHYMVAISSARPDEQGFPVTALLETNYKFAQLYNSEATRTWRLPERRQVDLDYLNGDVFVLQREMHEESGAAVKYRDMSTVTSFAPQVKIERPRQLVTTPEGIYILDLEGRRLLLLEPDYGQVLRVLQLPQDDPVSAVAFDHENGRLLLAGRDRLYFVGRPEHRVAIPADGDRVPIHSYDSAVLKKLDYFVVPIGGSNITFRDFQMPGAPRHYRLGVHYGFDLYWQPGTKVVAVGDGVVIRADNDYVGPTSADLMAWSESTARAGYTSDDLLDKYMGRQVWIEHAPGIVSRYAHLRSIEPGIIAGTAVSRGQVIGQVGNSGSPASLESESSDAHLHFELWLGNHYLGQYLRPIEAREWIERLFPVSRE